MRSILSKTPKVFLMSVLTILLTVSCGKDQPKYPKVDGVDGPYFHVQDGNILITMTLEMLEVDMGGRVFFGRDLPNSFMEVTPAQFGGTFLQVSLDYSDLEKGRFDVLDPESLPGGRPFPSGIGGISGKLPSFSVAVPGLNDTQFYVGKRLFGFFAHLKKVTFPIGVTHRLRMDGENIGTISFVGSDQQGENAGILVMLNLDRSAEKKIKRLIRHSKRPGNRGKKF